jgi:hypothetical protein
MTRIDWDKAGARIFEAGVDRGVLYVGDAPGVPWVGLISVNHTKTGGDSKPRFLDGVQISNYTSPERFAATLEAYTYPTEFEPCDGISLLQNGLRATRQRRAPFGMVYRTKVGNEIVGVEHAYKIHVMYNLRAEPSNRGYRTLGDDEEAMTFSWDLTSRGELVAGLVPTAHFVLDSRDIPAELLATVENIFYGDSTQEPSLPSAGELFFMFDSYNDLVYDAGGPFTPAFSIHDAGSASTAVTSTVDSGGV